MSGAEVTTAQPARQPDAQPDESRPSRLPRPARRQQLLSAAQEVFVTQGYHAAAMDDIAERAGVSKPVLYQHFPSKLELYVGLLDTTAEELLARLRRAMEVTTDNGLRVENAIIAYFDFVDESLAFRLVFESDLRNEPAVRERVERFSRACMEAVADTIAADTGVPRAQAELLSVALIGISEVSARYWLDTDRAVGKSDAVRLLSHLAWRGISGFPRQP
ncbi:MAG: TetR/AcrR family transcriptional regulator [Actinomycetota bacterium]|nr:TetR/AcrR family transcriptional regulator [Actinomycetota bacterium]